MKVKVYVIDFEIPFLVKKWGLRIGIPAALLFGGGAIAYATLPQPQFVDGNVLTAAELNGDLNSLDTRVTTLEATIAALPSIVDNGSSGYVRIGATQIVWGGSATPSGAASTNGYVRAIFPAPFVDNNYSITATADTPWRSERQGSGSTHR